MKYVRLFQKRGLHVIICDHGHSDENGGHLVTMGFREKEDLQTVADAVMARLGPNVKIGTHGESMGGATVVQHAAKRGYSRLFLMPDAKHAESICAHGDIYEKLISGFLQKVDAEGE